MYLNKVDKEKVKKGYQKQFLFFCLSLRKKNLSLPKPLMHGIFKLAFLTDPLIALGKDYIIYRKPPSGELFGMGYNHSGNLGVGDFNDRLIDSTEISFPVDEKIKDIACGYDHSVLLTINGTVWGSGRNQCGQLGQKNEKKNSSFIKLKIPNNEKISRIYCGEFKTFLIPEKKNYLYVCGSNMHCSLGMPNTKPFHYAVEETDLSTLTKVSLPDSEEIMFVASGWHHTLILTLNGNVYVSGNNDRGQIGLGLNNLYCSVFTKIAIPDNKKIISMSTGRAHSIFLTETGEVFGCGSSSRGQLSNTEDSDVPTALTIPDNEKIIAVSCGDDHTLMLTDSNKVLG
ncbi:MAG: hypothetical protein HYX60_00680, partial [Legionella longbeachae]|nr:hypothetical protein [Legionella longbeachae]